MLKLRLVPQAVSDLEAIFEYTLLNWSLTQAEIYQDLLFETMNKILSSQNIGKKYLFKKGKYRTVKTSKHIIFYRIEDEYCIIIRILHERMDLNSHLI